MLKTGLEEHRIIAHCAAYLIGEKKCDIKKIAVKSCFKDEVIYVIKKDLETKWKKSGSKDFEKIVNNISFNNKYNWDIQGYYKPSDNIQKAVRIETKGGKEPYGIYTLLGQMLTYWEGDSDYWWYGVACPASWAKVIHRRFTKGGKIRLFIQKIIDLKKYQDLQFYFFNESGYVFAISWFDFLKDKKQLECF